MLNWAVELESPIDLKQSGWNQETLRPGDGITVQGISARNGSRQAWARSVVVTATGREVLNGERARRRRRRCRRARCRSSPTARRGSAPRPGASGYWAYPSATALVENGVKVDIDEYGLLKNVGRRRQGGADAAVGAGALPEPAAPFPRRTIRRSSTASRPAARGSSSSRSASSSWRTGSGSASSC